MSFSSSRKRALDEQRHINERRVAVRSCIERCLYFSGYNGYTAIVNYYDRHHRLNQSKLTDQDIKTIIAELTALRAKSIKILQEFEDYRTYQKALGFRVMWYRENQVAKICWERIHELWDKFDTESNREAKRRKYEERRRQFGGE